MSIEDISSKLKRVAIIVLILPIIILLYNLHIDLNLDLIIADYIAIILSHGFGITILIAISLAAFFIGPLIEEIRATSQKKNYTSSLRMFLFLLLFLDVSSLILSAFWVKFASLNYQSKMLINNLSDYNLSATLLMLFIAIGSPTILFRRLEILREIVSETFAWLESTLYIVTLEIFLLSIFFGVFGKQQDISVGIISGGLFFGVMYYLTSGIILPTVIKSIILLKQRQEFNKS